MPEIIDISSRDIWDLPKDKLLVLVHPLGSILFSNEGKYWCEVSAFPEIQEIAESVDELLGNTLNAIRKMSAERSRESFDEDSEVFLYRVF